MTLTIDAPTYAELVSIAEWYVFYYIKHPVQHYNVLEMALVLQTLSDITSVTGATNYGDIVGQMLDDTIDSIALQKIVDIVYN